MLCLWHIQDTFQKHFEKSQIGKKQKHFAFFFTNTKHFFQNGLLDEALDEDPMSSDIPDSTLELDGHQDLDEFLKQFVLVKTPYGYGLAKASPANEMVRVQRSRQQVYM